MINKCTSVMQNLCNTSTCLSVAPVMPHICQPLKNTICTYLLTYYWGSEPAKVGEQGCLHSNKACQSTGNNSVWVIVSDDCLVWRLRSAGGLFFFTWHRDTM